MTLIPFLIVSTIAIAFALMLVVLRNAVHGALCLVVNFAAIAVCFLMLGAEFIAVVQVAVYAGAIMVLFLFVLMLLNTEGSEQALSGHPVPQVLAALALGVLLLVEVAVLGPRASALTSQAPAVVAPGFGSPAMVGGVLFSRYLIPFELTSIVLLVGIVGAVVLTKRRPA